MTYNNRGQTFCVAETTNKWTIFLLTLTFAGIVDIFDGSPITRAVVFRYHIATTPKTDIAFRVNVVDVSSPTFAVGDKAILAATVRTP